MGAALAGAAGIVRRGGRWATPQRCLVACVVVWCSTFGVLVCLRHARFASFDFDAGIFDQAIWLLAHGETFITVRGLDVFGQHASPAFYLLVPFYWLGAGPNFLDVVQVVSLGSSAVAVYQVGKFHLRDGWLPVGLAVGFLLHPSVQWFAQELFHPEVVAIAPLLFAYLAALHRRWYWFAGLAIFAMAWKEDLAVAVAVLGVVLLLRKEVRAGALTLLGAAVWFGLATALVNHEAHGVFYVREFYGDLGSSGMGVAWTVITHPALVFARLGHADALGYARSLLGPLGLVPLLSPVTLAIGFPQALLNLISVQSFTWSPRFHYAAVPVAAAALATVEGVASVRRAGLRRVLAGLVVISACLATVSSGTSPVSHDFRAGMWPLVPNARQAALAAAVRLPPRNAVVSASYLLVAHLTHRSGIYSFPNPWIVTNYGLDSTRGANPDVVKWLVVDRPTVGPAERKLLDRLVASGTFRIVSDRAEIVVAVRSR